MAVARCARSGESIEARVSYGESQLTVKLERLVEDGRHNVLVVMQDLSEGHRLEATSSVSWPTRPRAQDAIMAILGAAELLATGEDATRHEEPLSRPYLLREPPDAACWRSPATPIARGWDLRSLTRRSST